MNHQIIERVLRLVRPGLSVLLLGLLSTAAAAQAPQLYIYPLKQQAANSRTEIATNVIPGRSGKPAMIRAVATRAIQRTRIRNRTDLRNHMFCAEQVAAPRWGQLAARSLATPVRELPRGRLWEAS
jgi:hypothetical protein